jgi:hypothetical protein
MKFAAALLLGATLGNTVAWGVLGQTESSVADDQRFLGGAHREEAHPGYKVHQITAKDGGVVKEFVSPTGMVFEIAWQSGHIPNLEQLLGPNMAELQTKLSTAAPRHTRGPMVVHTDHMVFVSAGHMRYFHGYAYVPSLVPANVAPEAIQ